MGSLAKKRKSEKTNFEKIFQFFQIFQNSLSLQKPNALYFELVIYSLHLKIRFLNGFIVNHVLKVLIVPKVPFITKTEF
jgi:hypothetical protein